MLSGFGGSAQVTLQGEVTFITANNVYVRFDRTDGIAIGDTLSLILEGKADPCLVVTSKSSTSCVCRSLPDRHINLGDRVSFDRVMPVAGASDMIPPAAEGGIDTTRTGTGKGRERVRGRVSAASYSTIPSLRENDHRLMYRFSMNADHIANSPFSAQMYMNYRQLFPAYEETYPQRTEYFNIYDLAVTYAPDSTLTLALGRKVNSNASSLGAIDGLQAEKSFGHFYAGGIVGSRPDLVDYGLNTSLFEYGGYLGAQVNNKKVRSRSTLGLLQQTNNGAVDRQYTYFQNSTAFGRNTDLFSSFELDLYNALTGEARLTNLYVSARYRFDRKLDLFASYDSRKRIVYYETYRDEVEQLLDDDEARQGARVRLGYRPARQFSVAVSYGNRFESDGQDRSENINGMVTMNVVPELMGRWTFQVNRNTSNYLQSDVLSIRHSRTLIDRKMNASLYFRAARYTYTTRMDENGLAIRSEQQYYGLDLSYTFGHGFVFSVLGELATMGEEKNYRLNTCLIKRFDSKRTKR